MRSKVKLTIVGPNQTEVEIGEKVLFFSYDTLVGLVIDGEVYVTTRRYSNTTSRHISAFQDRYHLGESVSQDLLERLAWGGIRERSVDHTRMIHDLTTHYPWCIIRVYENESQYQFY